MATTNTAAATTADEIMTKRAVAELLKVSMRQVELLTQKGRIAKPFYLGTQSPRWKRSELLASLEANQAGGDR